MTMGGDTTTFNPRSRRCAVGIHSKRKNQKGGCATLSLVDEGQEGTKRKSMLLSKGVDWRKKVMWNSLLSEYVLLKEGKDPNRVLKMFRIVEDLKLSGFDFDNPILLPGLFGR